MVMIPGHLSDARSQIGYLEESNGATKFGRWYGANAGDPSWERQDWCGMFVSWCFTAADAPLPVMQHKGYSGFASAQIGFDWCRQRGLIVPAHHALPGDVLFFDWKGDGHVDHVGFCDHWPADGFAATVEGNTRNAVARRYRGLSLVAGAVKWTSLVTAG